jgi:mono/diheme cytochrome c family protein
MFRSCAIAILAIAGVGVAGPAAAGADDATKQQENAPQQGVSAPSGSPAATAGSAAKGELKSPYPDFAKVADEGHKKFMAAGCNGCHGGGGGGGMGPPLTNEVWIYGKDDDTLFRLVALGSDGLQKQGYARKGSENVVGPMPAMGGVVKSDDDLWKIIAWIRSVNPSSASAAADTVRTGRPISMGRSIGCASPIGA